MQNNKCENHSIHCTVTQCAHHCNNNYCSLNTVDIGTHEANPTVAQCVDCNSFKLRNNCDSCQ